MSDSSDDMEFYSGMIDDDDECCCEDCEDRDKVIAELAVVLEFLNNHIGSKPYSILDQWGPVLERVYRTTGAALTTHAEAIKRARGMT
jgi:hypothetical protein